MKSIQERFWAKVDKTETCWLWTAAKSNQGYGVLQTADGLKYAHRLSYEHHIGPIPNGLFIDHECRTRGCVNPLHLRAVTPKENTNAFGSLTGAHHRRKTHCPQGHEYTAVNTNIDERGGRRCLICKRKSSLKWLHKAKRLAV